MRSDFERQAAKAAVEAVERRVERDRQFRAREERKKKVRSALAFMMLALMAVGGVEAWRIYDGENDLELLNSFFSKYVKPLVMGFGASADDDESQSHQQYYEAMNSLMTGELRLIGAMPAELSPRRAKAGTCYAALVLGRDGFAEVYQLTVEAGGKLSVLLLSPVEAPRPVAYESFKAAHGKSAFLLSVGGRAYLCGSMRIADGMVLRAKVIDASLGAGGPAKR